MQKQKPHFQHMNGINSAANGIYAKIRTGLCQYDPNGLDYP